MRRSSRTSCGRIACSTVWNGPTSAAVALIVPANAVIASTSGASAYANTTPLIAITADIATTVRRRPNPSARNDQTSVLASDPSIAAVRIAPIHAAEIDCAVRCSVSAVPSAPYPRLRSTRAARIRAMSGSAWLIVSGSRGALTKRPGRGSHRASRSRDARERRGRLVRAARVVRSSRTRSADQHWLNPHAWHFTQPSSNERTPSQLGHFSLYCAELRGALDGFGIAGALF